MTTWTFKRLSTGQTFHVRAGSRWNDGVAAFQREMLPILTAARSDGQRPSSARVEVREDGNFELIAVDDKARSTRFQIHIKWYKPTVVSETARIDSAMDGGHGSMGMINR